MFYAYPDWYSVEYEADYLREFCNDFADCETTLNGGEIVVLETEG